MNLLRPTITTNGDCYAISLTPQREAFWESDPYDLKSAVRMLKRTNRNFKVCQLNSCYQIEVNALQASFIPVATSQPIATEEEAYEVVEQLILQDIENQYDEGVYFV